MGTDASNQSIPGILSQYHIVNRAKQLHHIEDYAKTNTAIQRNWPMHDTALFASVYCFPKWQDWLGGVSVNIYTDL